MLRLPDALRSAFKAPMGPVYTDSAALLAEAGSPLVTVGDVVTYHLRGAGRIPDVAVIDGKTKREAVDAEVREALAGDGRIEVTNPAATLSRELLDALVDALATEERVVLFVTGEEDLATLPAIVATPLGGSVVYGQPDEGMVLVTVTDQTKREARTLLSRMDGDSEAVLSLLGA